MTSAPEPARFLDWDTKHFGVRIARMTSRSPDAAAMDRALEWCASERIDCLYFLGAGDDPVVLRLARERGFAFVDVRMTFERGTGDLAPDPGGTSHPVVRTWRESDVAALRDLAAGNHVQSRFFVDDRFDRRACAELYAAWIERSCRGWADAVWVAEHEGRVAGYLSGHLREGGLGEIGLVGVSADAKGRGLGRALVHRGLEWFRERGCTRVSVVTQGSNVAAQRLYQAGGFRTRSVEIWHHRWFEPHEEPRP